MQDYAVSNAFKGGLSVKLLLRSKEEFDWNSFQAFG